MPKYEVEFDDKGEFLGDIPAELKAVIERSEIASYGNGVRNGQGKAAEEAKKQLSESIAAERAKWEAQYALEREKWPTIEAESKALKSQLLDITREHQKTLQSREDVHASEILKRSEKLKVHESKIRTLVNQNLKALASQAGARDESLPELEMILGNAVGYDDAMEPFIKGPDGQPRLLHGKPMSLEAFVKDYMDTHPHHRKPDPRRGGGAPGGASFRNLPHATVDEAAATHRIHQGDRSADAINDLFEATRKQRAH